VINQDSVRICLHPRVRSEERKTKARYAGNERDGFRFVAISHPYTAYTCPDCPQQAWSFTGVHIRMAPWVSFPKENT
jgi:hypothetical protein